MPLDLAAMEARARRGAAEDEPAPAGATVDGGDEWGLVGWPWPHPAITTSDPGASLTPAPVIPTVVRFRPRHGWTGVDRHAALSVRFTTAMDQSSTEAAFHASIGSTAVTGSIRWAEGDTVLVLAPSAALPYGARVELLVDGGATSAAGIPIAGPASVVFTVEARPAPTPPPTGAATSGWRWPLAGSITQYFGQTLTSYGVHQGIDIDGDTGDPVVAAASGTVVIAGFADDCGGLQVRIDHGNGLRSWYRHLSAIRISVGSQVTAGTVVGLVGNTGCSLGSHLHFGVTRDGEFVDPLRYLPAK